MKLIFRKAHAYFYAACVGVFYFLFWPLFWYFSRKPSRYGAMSRWRKRLGLFSSAAAGIFYRFDFEEPVDWSKTYIICGNHTSYLDITAMCLLVKSTCSFIGKADLADGPVTRLFFKSLDIPVDRDSKMSSFRAFKKAGERLGEGMTMIIFPEGGIASEYPPRLQEFKNGPFRLAIEYQVPIIPVTSAKVWEMFWDDAFKHGSNPGIARFHVHKPISTEGLTIADADALRDRVFEVMNAALKREK